MSVILDQELKRPSLLAGIGWPKNATSKGKKGICETSSEASIREPTLVYTSLQDLITRVALVITARAGA